jgi:hypothetical protein
MTIGGYKSRDPVPTVAQLEDMVDAGEIHYVLIRDAPSDAGSGSTGSEDPSEHTEDTLQDVATWVAENGTAVPASEYDGDSIDGTLYFLP